MNPEPHIFQFIAACIEKAIQLGYEYDQEKSLQTIHEEAKEYIAGCGQIDQYIEGVMKDKNIHYEINGRKIVSRFPFDKLQFVDDDGTLYLIRQLYTCAD